MASRPNQFDVVLAEVLCLCGTCVLVVSLRQFSSALVQARAVTEESPAFVKALNGLPLVLMSEACSATEVLKSIELGAVEYIEKPLSLLKLRNIWQHVVRKVCGKDPTHSFELIVT